MKFCIVEIFYVYSNRFTEDILIHNIYVKNDRCGAPPCSAPLIIVKDHTVTIFTHACIALALKDYKLDITINEVH
jgi:hypothetical protein